MQVRPLFWVALVCLLCCGCGEQVKPQVEARFEVPSLVGSEGLSYTVHLTNTGQTEVRGVVVVANLGDHVDRLEVEPLGPGQRRTLHGQLGLPDRVNEAKFTARVLGGSFSYRSQEVDVHRSQGLGGVNRAADYASNISSRYSKRAPQQQIQQQELTPDQIGDVPGDEMAFGSLEEVEVEADVDNLISQVRQTDCPTSRKLLQEYKRQGNEKASEFLIGQL